MVGGCICIVPSRRLSGHASGRSWAEGGRKNAEGSPVRSSKYRNNGIEQDHRRGKQRIRPILGFKEFETAAVTISGIWTRSKNQKQQFKVGKLSGRSTTIPVIWTAVVGA
jgi:transposase-like protein